MQWNVCTVADPTALQKTNTDIFEYSANIGPTVIQELHGPGLC